MRVKLREIAESSHLDPRQAVLSAVGDYSGIEVFHNLVLVATYVEPEKTKSGIYLPDRSQEEARFQGKSHLVLKTGPLAFKDDGLAKFGGVNIREGDWVLIRPSDALEFFLVDDTGTAGASCRLVEDICIKCRVSRPDLIY